MWSTRAADPPACVVQDLLARPQLSKGSKSKRTCIIPASKGRLVFLLKYHQHTAVPQIVASSLQLTGTQLAIIFTLCLQHLPIPVADAACDKRHQACTGFYVQPGGAICNLFLYTWSWYEPDFDESLVTRRVWASDEHRSVLVQQRHRRAHGDFQPSQRRSQVRDSTGSTSAGCRQSDEHRRSCAVRQILLRLAPAPPAVPEALHHVASLLLYQILSADENMRDWIIIRRSINFLRGHGLKLVGKSESRQDGRPVCIVSRPQICR